LGSSRGGLTLLSSSLSVVGDMDVVYIWASVTADSFRLGGRVGGDSVCSMCLSAEWSRYAGRANETGGAGVETTWLEGCLWALVALPPGTLDLRVRDGEVEVEGRHTVSMLREASVPTRTTRGSNVDIGRDLIGIPAA
jgi:hypothetical protein